MPDYVLKRPSECAEGEVCFRDGSFALLAIQPTHNGWTYGNMVARCREYGREEQSFLRLLNLACDLRDRAEKAEAEVARLKELLEGPF